MALPPRAKTLARNDCRTFTPANIGQQPPLQKEARPRKWTGLVREDFFVKVRVLTATDGDTGRIGLFDTATSNSPTHTSYDRLLSGQLSLGVLRAASGLGGLKEWSKTRKGVETSNSRSAKQEEEATTN